MVLFPLYRLGNEALKGKAIFRSMIGKRFEGKLKDTEIIPDALVGKVYLLSMGKYSEKYCQFSVKLEKHIFTYEVVKFSFFILL